MRRRRWLSEYTRPTPGQTLLVIFGHTALTNLHLAAFTVATPYLFAFVMCSSLRPEVWSAACGEIATTTFGVYPPSAPHFEAAPAPPPLIADPSAWEAHAF